MSDYKLNVYDYALEKGARYSIGMRGVEWFSRCVNPNCSSQHDAFSVQPEGKRTGRWAGYGAWKCRKCWDPAEMVTWRDGIQRKRGWGSIADLVMLCEGMEYREAEAFILAREGATAPTSAQTAPRQPGRARMSDEEWQTKYQEYLKKSQGCTPSERELVLSYIASRGIAVETAKLLKFGYSFDNVKLKDGTYRSIPFMVIPWYRADGTLFRKINRRNLHNPLPDDEPKYQLVQGSETDDLYLADSLLSQKRPTFLVESELDAATLLQEAGGLVNVVATGSTGHGRNVLNESRLRRQPFVFVSFDNDDKGEEASIHWLGKFDKGKSIRYKPLLHDVNDMHTHGMSVRQWVMAGIQYFASDVASLSQLLPDVQKLVGTNQQNAIVLIQHNSSEQLEVPLAREATEDTISDTWEIPFEEVEDESPCCFECANDRKDTVGTHQDSEELWHCEKHWQGMHTPLEQAKHYAHTLTTALPNWWTVSEPMNMTAQQYIEQRKAEIDEEALQRRLEAHPTQESYWTNLKSKLNRQGYDEQVARGMDLLQERMRRYRETWFGEVA